MSINCVPNLNGNPQTKKKHQPKKTYGGTATVPTWKVFGSRVGPPRRREDVKDWHRKKIAKSPTRSMGSSSAVPVGWSGTRPTWDPANRRARVADVHRGGDRLVSIMVGHREDTCRRSGGAGI